MLVCGYNNIILLPNCTMLYYVFSGPLSLRAYVPEIKFNNKNISQYLLCRSQICYVTYQALSPILMQPVTLYYATKRVCSFGQHILDFYFQNIGSWSFSVATLCNSFPDNVKSANTILLHLKTWLFA